MKDTTFNEYSKILFQFDLSYEGPTEPSPGRLGGFPQAHMKSRAKRPQLTGSTRCAIKWYTQIILEFSLIQPTIQFDIMNKTSLQSKLMPLSIDQKHPPRNQLPTAFVPRFQPKKTSQLVTLTGIPTVSWIIHKQTIRTASVILVAIAHCSIRPSNVATKIIWNLARKGVDRDIVINVACQQ